MLLRCCIVLLLAAAGGCQVYDPALLDRDGGRMGACAGRRPPPRPDIANTDEPGEITFGLRDVVLDQRAGDRWRDVGFNLDGYCTGPPERARECEPAGSVSPVSDGNEGIDNTFGAELFPIVEATVMGLEDTARAAQLAGVGLPVLRIRNWNGEPNDSRIEVTITQAVASAPANPDGSAPDVVIDEFRAELPDGTPAPPPVWDGRDYAWMRADTFLAGDPEQPFVYDDNAYIADNTVVVNLPDRVEILFRADNAGVLVKLTGGLAVGTISEDRMRLNDVVVGGRWSVIDLLQTAENIGVCLGTTPYNVLRAHLETIVDVRSETGSGGPEIECDAISIGVGFSGYRMNWGGLTPGRALESLCEDLPDGGVPMLDGGMSDAGMSDAGPSDAGMMDAGL